MSKEKVWLVYVCKDGEEFKITQNLNNGMYLLYKLVDGNWINLKKKVSNPTDLEKYIEKLKRSDDIDGCAK